MNCNYNHKTIFHRITRIPILWFIVTFLCSQIGHSTSCQFDQFFVKTVILVLTVLMHFSPSLAKLLRLIVVFFLLAPASPPHLFRIAFLPLPQHHSARNLYPLQSLRRGAAICAPLSRQHASVALRRRVGREVPSKPIISVGERSERFRRMRALLAVGRVVLSN